LVVGGTLSDFKGAGALYTATFTPAAGATSAMVFVDSDKFRSAAGVANQDGLDTNNILSLLIGSHGCEDVTTLGLEDVLAVPPSACLGQYVLKVEGDPNDVVNLKRSGTGGDQWTASGMVTVDNQLYQLWTHSANSKAFVLIDADIHTVVPNMV
jgi:hypothetical protein